VVSTDVSLLPFSSEISENITRIPQPFNTQYYMKTDILPHASITFKKSGQSTKYTRTFNKIDAYLSYVGGLVGTIIGIIFIMGPYTEKAFEISLAKKLMLDNDEK
jgi:hypothetical protein